MTSSARIASGVSRVALAVISVVLFLGNATAWAQPYSARRTDDVVQLEDARSATVVSILPGVGNIAFSMKVKGHEVLRWPYESVEQFKSRPGLSGIPFVGPWANRLDEQAFYANGKRYAFDMDIGNIRGATPIHGFLTTNDKWQVVELRSDAASAWVTSRLEFFRQPAWMKQWPFAHTVELTYRLKNGELEVHTAIAKCERRPDAGCNRVPSVLPADRFATQRLDIRARREDPLAARAQQGADGRDRVVRGALPRSSIGRTRRLQPRRRVFRPGARRERARHDVRNREVATP
jgi:hypothetical protein